MIATALTPWHCHICGRMEDGDSQTCPNCRSRRQHVSRYEWFLADAIEDRLRACGIGYQIDEQWPIRDNRGFTWYFDIRVAVPNVVELIEVNGLGHLEHGHRDDDKFRAVPADCSFRIVANEECRLAVVHQTAAKIVAGLIRGAL